MIIGVGIDIVEIARIGSLLEKFQKHFLKKIYTEEEIRFCYSRKSVVSSLAKMFALKEATIKALSDAKGIKWHEMEVLHNSSGKPFMNLTGKALANLEAKAKHFNIQASVSDERECAVAYVIIEGIEN